ncbi:S8 family serine peptidase [Cecembia calidifontis]|uniref:Peptidase inhibitor I9 n=1 Tax=Cecembia calidifontis TaxID=1187080 RepID=A0A4Q7PEZ4_9BACT|nr:S8 family serine peptidase [Cecembia calidifontis]RZS97422.1 peptidase inhibitor I9 [Cecembia calidifontis]
MFKKIYRFIGKPAVVGGLALAFITFACQENQETPTMELEEQFIRYQNGDVIPGSFIVVLNPEGITFRKDGSYEGNQAALRTAANSLLAKYRISEEKLGFVYGTVLDGFSVRLSSEEFEVLKNDPAVKYIEKDRVISIAQGNRPGGGGGGGGSTGQVIPWGITRVGGFVNYTGNNVAWVLDTGIELTHPDLNVSTSNGFTAFTSGRDANFNDLNGHGTHVAGTIAAINNNIGVVGVAAGAPVVPVKVLDSRGSGSYSGVIAGVNWVGARGTSGDVANMSLGGPISQALDDAVLAASNNGIKFVLAAGNSSTNANNSSPARVNGPNIWTISAMNSSDVFASFSNFGNPPVDYCAPGVSINSTWLKGGYNSISGTSMASPHAAGVLLLGNAKTSGFVQNDPDGNPDPIISR